MATNNNTTPNPFVVRVNGLKIELVYAPGDRSVGFGEIKLRKHTSYGDYVSFGETREAVRKFLAIWKTKESEAAEAHAQACKAYNQALDRLDQISAREYRDLDAKTEETSVTYHDAYAIRSRLEQIVKTF